MFRRIFSYTPTLGESWIMFVCVVLFGSILAIPTTLVPEINFISTFMAYILTLTPAFVYAYLKGKRGNYTPERRINAPHWGKLPPLLFALMLPLIYAAYTVVTEPLGSLVTTPEWFDSLMKQTALGGNIYWSILTTCICAPILEETLCRGIMLRGMVENGTSPAKAIIWSALIFGIMHMNPWQAIPAFLLGLLFGWLYYTTGSIWAPTVLHIINNATSTILFHFFPHISSSTTLRELIGDTQIYFAIFAISIAVLALSYFIITKFVGKRNEQKTVISA